MENHSDRRWQKSWPVFLPACCLMLMLGPVKASWAVTRIVPTQFATIQSAMVASAASGDTVLVNPGTYHEKVDFLGKEIVLRSVAGAEATVIDAEGLDGPGILLVGVGQRGRVIGFTIKNGTGLSWMGSRNGGGLHIREGTGDGPLISDNVVTNNSAMRGGGVDAVDAARLVRNRILSNSSGWHGGGMFCSGKIIVTDNEIVGNVDHYSDGNAGGVSFGVSGPMEFARNIIACNEAYSGGGCALVGSPEGTLFAENTVVLNRGLTGVGGVAISLWEDRALEFRGNVVAFNIQGGGIDCRRVGLADDLDSSCNDVWGNGPDFLDDECGPFVGVNNNIREEPMFGVITPCPQGSNAFCLDDESPLLPANSPPGCGLIGARGLCGDIGIADETAAPEASGDRVSAQPNPFATRTTLVIDLVAPSQIDLRITNALGRVVAEQSLGSLHAGRHRWIWDGRDTRGQKAPAGVYYAEIQAGGRPLVTRLMVLR